MVIRIYFPSRKSDHCHVNRKQNAAKSLSNKNSVNCTGPIFSRTRLLSAESTLTVIKTAMLFPAVHGIMDTHVHASLIRPSTSRVYVKEFVTSCACVFPNRSKELASYTCILERNRSCRLLASLRARFCRIFSSALNTDRLGNNWANLPDIGCNCPADRYYCVMYFIAIVWLYPIKPSLMQNVYIVLKCHDK